MATRPNYQEPEKYDPSFDYDTHTVIEFQPGGWRQVGIMRNFPGALSLVDSMKKQFSTKDNAYSIVPGVHSEYTGMHKLESGMMWWSYRPYVNGHVNEGKVIVQKYFGYDLKDTKTMTAEEARAHYAETRADIAKSNK